MKCNYVIPNKYHFLYEIHLTILIQNNYFGIIIDITIEFSNCYWPNYIEGFFHEGFFQLYDWNSEHSQCGQKSDIATFLLKDLVSDKCIQVIGKYPIRERICGAWYREYFTSRRAINYRRGNAFSAIKCSQSRHN